MHTLRPNSPLLGGTDGHVPVSERAARKGDAPEGGVQIAGDEVEGEPLARAVAHVGPDGVKQVGVEEHSAALGDADVERRRESGGGSC